MRTIRLKTGERLPVLGLGSWRMGERASQRSAEVKALRLGLDLGMPLIDTAEMYGEGVAEEIVAEAMAGKRDSVYLVSKVYPHNASRRGAVAAFERLKRDGKIRRWGVSNFDRADLRELAGVAGGEACVANQVLYHLGSRGIE